MNSCKYFIQRISHYSNGKQASEAEEGHFVAPYLISYSFKLQCRRKQLRYFRLLFVTALIITRGSLWREPNMLNPNKCGQLHPDLQRAAVVHRMSTKPQVLPLGHDHGTAINFGFVRRVTAWAPKRPSSALVLHLPTRSQALVVSVVLGWELGQD